MERDELNVIAASLGLIADNESIQNYSSIVDNNVSENVDTNTHEEETINNMNNQENLINSQESNENDTDGLTAMVL